MSWIWRPHKGDKGNTGNTGAAGATGATGRNPSRGAWQPNTDYKQGDLVSYAGSFWTAIADFTSGSSFNAGNWTQSTVAAGQELNVTEITAQPANLGTGTGDTAFRDLAGWTVPALAAQDRPLLIRLVLANLQIGNAGTLITFEVTDAATAVGAAGAPYLSRNVYYGVAFAVQSPLLERRIPAGQALPALKVRYKLNGNAANGAGFVAGTPGAYVRLEEILR